MNQVQVFVPPPANWQDFEGLVEEVAKSKYVPGSVQTYGRQGQVQNGVDVYAVDVFDNKIGIQCKETKSDALTAGYIDREIAKAKKFGSNLDLFIIATTQRADAKLQDHIFNLNSGNSCDFTIAIWFWDDINRDINRSQAVMASSYNIYSKNFGKLEVENHLSALRLSFDRPAFSDNFLVERNYDQFEIALVATKAALKTGFLRDSFGKMVTETIPSCMIGDADYKSFVLKIEKFLERIYQAYMRDKQLVLKNPSQLAERAGEYNIQRRKLISVINKKLVDFSMDEIHLNY